jgi:hypothetical protein
MARGAQGPGESDRRPAGLSARWRVLHRGDHQAVTGVWKLPVVRPRFVTYSNEAKKSCSACAGLSRGTAR